LELVRAVRRDDSGAIAIIVALFAVVLFGFAALVVDVGNASDVKAQTASAADAAALAGSRDLATWVNTHGNTPDPALYDVVTGAVSSNLHYSGDDWASCPPETTGYTPLEPPDYPPDKKTNCIQYKIDTDPVTMAVTGSAVRVRIPTRRVPATFGGLFGVSSISVSPFATARAGQDPPSPCEPCDPPLGADGQPTGPITSSPVVTEPTEPGTTDANGCPGPGPAVYSDANVDLVSGTCSLSGTYLFVDHDFVVDAGTAVTGNDVTLIFKGSATLTVNGTINLTAPGTGTNAHLAIVFEQSPSSSSARRFELGDRFDIRGSVYALSGTLWVTNDGDCPGDGTSACWIHDLSQGPDSVMAITSTEFGDGNRIPTVHSDHPATLPPPQPSHLIE
jgi:hypothetical protein